MKLALSTATAALIFGTLLSPAMAEDRPTPIAPPKNLSRVLRRSETSLVDTLREKNWLDDNAPGLFAGGGRRRWRWWWAAAEAEDAELEAAALGRIVPPN